MTDSDNQMGHRTTRRRSGVLLATIVSLTALTAGAAGAAVAGGFRDVRAGSAHTEGITWAAEHGITEGCGDGTDFCPDHATTRAQMATFLRRLAESGAVDAGTVGGRTAADLVGATGPAGPAGPVGPTGETGPAGPSGADAYESETEVFVHGDHGSAEANGAALLAAYAAIDDAAASRPYLVRLAPGTFDLDGEQLVMQRYVSLAGAGAGATTIVASRRGTTTSLGASIRAAADTEISRLAVRNEGSTDDPRRSTGIMVAASPVRIDDVQVLVAHPTEGRGIHVATEDGALLLTRSQVTVTDAFGRALVVGVNADLSEAGARAEVRDSTLSGSVIVNWAGSHATVEGSTMTSGGTAGNDGTLLIGHSRVHVAPAAVSGGTVRCAASYDADFQPVEPTCASGG